MSFDQISASTRSSVADGRPPVASRGLASVGTAFASNSGEFTSKSFHTVLSAFSDFRTLHSMFAAEGTITNDVIVNETIEFNSTRYSLTYAGGKPTGFWPANGYLLSDPFPIDFSIGATFYLHTHVLPAFGPSTTLAASAAAADTTISLTAPPAATFQFPGGALVGGEVVTIKSVTGSGPYTATLAAGLATLKASGATVQGQGYLNQNHYNDNGPSGGESFKGGLDYTLAGTYTGIANGTTTLTQIANIGDSTIKIVAPPVGNQYTIDSETVTVLSHTGIANPYTAYLSAPLTATHSSGATVTSNAGKGNGYSPLIVADRVSGTLAKPVIGLGDSIMKGQGNYSRSLDTSFANIAFATSRPLLNIGIQGEQASAFAVLASSKYRRMLINTATWALIQYGTNDLYLGSRTATQLQTDITTIFNLCKARGLRVALCTLVPRTTSTDSWVTTGNQTFVSSGAETYRKAYNVWVRANSLAADLVIDLAAVTDSGLAASSAETGLWRNISGVPITVDGVHPSFYGHQTMASTVSTASFT